MSTDNNKALETRYADRFLAFITSSNENERQDEVFHSLVSELRKKNALPDKIDFLDLGCGPGEMTRTFIKGFEAAPAGKPAHEVKAYGVELNEDHIRAAESNHGIHIVRQNIFEKNADFVKTAGLDHKPAAIIASHSAYYGPSPRIPQGTYDAPVLDQPKVKTLVQNLKRSMGAQTIGFLQHKATEPTNFLKRPHGTVIESDINRSLKKACEQEGMKLFPIQFKCKLKLNAATFPELSNEKLWEELRNPPSYPVTEFQNGKKIRDILEFLTHRGLEEMQVEERNQFLHRARMLIKRDEKKDGIDTYVQLNVVLSPDAPESLVRKVSEAAAATRAQHGLPLSNAIAA